MNASPATSSRAAPTGLPAAAALPWEWRRERLPLLGLVGLVLALWAPALALVSPVLYGDSVNEEFPRLVALARHLRQGRFPLWDFQTFGGAKPFYAQDAAVVFYPPLLPFQCCPLADDPARDLLVLFLVPVVLHVAWAAVGAYVFGRVVVGLHPVGAFVSGAAWALSPGLLTFADSLSVVVVFAHFPWIAAAISRFIVTGSCRWWAAGVLCGALALSVRHLNMLIREYFVLGAMAALLAALCGPDGRGWSDGLAAWLGPRSPGRRLCGALAIVVASVGLAAAPLAGALESVGWMTSSVPMTHEIAANLTSESSTPPMFFLTLLVPGFFGVLDSRHAWGLALTEGVTALSLPGGGLFTMTAVLVALVHWLPRRGFVGAERTLWAWTWIATLLLVLMALTVMGRYTPVFRGLCGLLPWCFRFPHAVYYRFGFCWSLAVLAGIGSSCLWADERCRERLARPWLPGLLVGLALLGVLRELLRGVPLQVGPEAALLVPAYRTLSAYGLWGWLLAGPLARFGLAAAVLLAGWRLLGPVWRPRLLAAGIAVEAAVMGAILIHVCNVTVQTRPWPDFPIRAVHSRFRTLADYPAQRIARLAGEHCAAADVRWTCELGVFDNQAWPTAGRSLLGYPAMPILPEFDALAKRFTIGWPYRLGYDAAPETVFRNLNVGAIVRLGHRDGSVRIDDQFSLQSFADPLPYAFTQDRLVVASPGEQLERLLDTDLRGASFVDEPVAAAIAAAGGTVGTAGTAAEFGELQRCNRVEAERDGPNEIAVTAEIERPALLVVVEPWHPGWRVTVDGVERAPLRVNHLQQAVWLPAGRHELRWRFFPSSLRFGILVSASCGIVMLGAALLAALRPRPRAGS